MSSYDSGSDVDDVLRQANKLQELLRVIQRASEEQLRASEAKNATLQGQLRASAATNGQLRDEHVQLRAEQRASATENSELRDALRDSEARNATLQKILVEREWKFIFDKEVILRDLKSSIARFEDQRKARVHAYIHSMQLEKHVEEQWNHQQDVARRRRCGK